MSNTICILLLIIIAIILLKSSESFYNPDNIDKKRSEDGENVSMKYDDYDRLVSEYWKCKANPSAQPRKIKFEEKKSKINTSSLKKWLIIISIILGSILFVALIVFIIYKIVKKYRNK